MVGKDFQSQPELPFSTRSTNSDQHSSYRNITQCSSGVPPVTTEKEIPIHRFEPDGTPVYTDKINGHFIWDVDPERCDADCECKACYKPVKSPCKSIRSRRDPKDPHSPWIPLSIYGRDLQILKDEGLLLDEPTEQKLPPTPAPIPCFMASNYDKDFPPLESSSKSERNLFSRPFIQSTEVLPDGSLKHPSQAEQVLNWHTRNATIQNRVLHSINQKIDQVIMSDNYIPKPRNTITSYFGKKDYGQSSKRLKSPCNLDAPSPSLSRRSELENVDTLPNMNIPYYERDLGSCVPIKAYPVDKRDEIRRIYVKMGSYQPILNNIHSLMIRNNGGDFNTLGSKKFRGLNIP
ncbi:hypothetical protein Ddye_032333 [Dipteronia dyeriana]|uniref:Uncharacterized protein n=1 Tax=Dipteronia dyeriana TaxID=168575 RepID=A0AAD9TK71_9ROSI|nr:hypothetical protein Ddye_032333 [Dipteronia dyeriana]